MKIYVITAGSYSCYGIYGVTTDPERAEDMRRKVDAWNHENSASIEEYEDGVFENDQLDHIVPCEYWNVSLTPGMAPIAYKRLDGPNLVMTVTDRVHKGDWKQPAPGRAYRRECWKVYYVSNIKADSEEQAVKIAIDEASKYRAKREGII